jgi:hypothetical protein
MITFKHSGNFNKTEKFLTSAQKLNIKSILRKYAIEGVNALSNATPRDTGKTADSWDYEIILTKYGNYRINWINTNVKDNVSIAMLIQYGHGTRSGTFVYGIDYINPVMKPIFDKIAENLWKEVTSL